MITSSSYSISPLTNSNNDSGRGDGSGMPSTRSPFSADTPELTSPVPSPADESSMHDVDHPEGGHEGAADEGGEGRADDPIVTGPASSNGESEGLTEADCPDQSPTRSP